MAAGGLAMAGAAGLIVAIGNAYTLDIGQIVTQPGVAATAGSALANSGVAAVPSNHRPPPSMSGGATAHGSVRNGAHLDVRRVSAALLTLRDATEAEMSDPQASTDDADAPGVLVLRGAQSDVLLQTTAAAMTQRGPRARLVEFDGIGHAPTLVAADQVEVVRQWLME